MPTYRSPYTNEDKPQLHESTSFGAQNEPETRGEEFR